MGALGTLSLPLLFSVNYQLSEDLKFSGKRTTAETTIGATAGLLIGGLLKSTSMILSPRYFFDPNAITNKITRQGQISISTPSNSNKRTSYDTS